MITICTGCKARYRLDAAKVPARLIRVRCPACASIFDLDGKQRTEPSATSPTCASPRPAMPTTMDESAPSAAMLQPAADEPRRGRRRRRDKTEMLARALVSDILVYNQAVRDKALTDGTLLETLGPEIKKSWELYKEKVGPEAATATTHFKDALNEILADGHQVF